MTLRRIWDKLVAAIGFTLTPTASNPGSDYTFWIDQNTGALRFSTNDVLLIGTPEMLATLDIEQRMMRLDRNVTVPIVDAISTLSGTESSAGNEAYLTGQMVALSLQDGTGAPNTGYMHGHITSVSNVSTGLLTEMYAHKDSIVNEGAGYVNSMQGRQLEVRVGPSQLQGDVLGEYVIIDHQGTSYTVTGHKLEMNEIGTVTEARGYHQLGSGVDNEYDGRMVFNGGVVESVAQTWSSTTINPNARAWLQTSSGITTTLWDDPKPGSVVDIINISDDTNMIAPGAGCYLQGATDPIPLHAGESLTLRCWGGTDWWRA